MIIIFFMLLQVLGGLRRDPAARRSRPARDRGWGGRRNRPPHPPAMLPAPGGWEPAGLAMGGAAMGRERETSCTLAWMLPGGEKRGRKKKKDKGKKGKGKKKREKAKGIKGNMEKGRERQKKEKGGKREKSEAKRS